VLQNYVHCASLAWLTGEPAAVGAAITVSLCGSLTHEPPCPVAPHHTASQRHGDGLETRVVFLSEPQREAEVRWRIGQVLRGGQAVIAERSEASWRLVEEGAGVTSLRVV
jgi:hypothetical protein